MWIGVAARLAHGSALVYDSHELWPDRNMRPEARAWLLACEALFVRLAHAVVMTSPAHAEVLARRYRVAEPVVVRNIPAEAAKVTSTDVARHRDGHEPVAIYAGGVLRHRGIEQAIQALGSVDGLRLRLLGPVEAGYRAELEAVAAGAGVGDRLEFASPVPPTEVVDALAGADVGLALFQPVCLSHRLVLPNKLFEYVRAGLPVVGSDLPMISRFVAEHGVGDTVDPQDSGELASALAATVEPKRNAELRAAAERAGRSLDWRSERELLAGVYRDALASANR
jgi:glycosyltransferase involved in cell wall biosynthesis